MPLTRIGALKNYQGRQLNKKNSDNIHANIKRSAKLKKTILERELDEQGLNLETAVERFDNQ